VFVAVLVPVFVSVKVAVLVEVLVGVDVRPKEIPGKKRTKKNNPRIQGKKLNLE
jgi:hypothetical protein